MSGKEAKLQELEGKIVSVCLSCPHTKHFLAGHFQCTVGWGHCHSKRVRRWLTEIKRLEVSNVENSKAALLAKLEEKINEQNTHRVGTEP